MGLFGRNPDKGLYTGDAPASMPGLRGAHPTRYTGPDHVDHVDHAVRPSMVPTGAPGILPTKPDAARGTGGVVVGSLATVALIVGGIFFFTARSEAPARSVGPGTTAGDLALADPGHVMDPDPQAGDAADATIEAGGFGDAATVAYMTAWFEVTPRVAFAQPGRGFAYATANDGPQLLVSARIARVDDGADPTGPMSFNWKFVTPDGTMVDAELLPTYHPNLANVNLVGGEATGGYLVFDTDATEGTLHFVGSFGGATQATWAIASRTMTTMAGELGEEVWPDISIPRFTVRAENPRAVTAADPGVWRDPASGAYLLVDVTLTPNEGSSGYLGGIDGRSFGFVPDGTATADDPFAGEVSPEASAMAGALGAAVITADRVVEGTLVFDTAARSGTLYFFNGGDWAIAKWAIDR